MTKIIFMVPCNWDGFEMSTMACCKNFKAIQLLSGGRVENFAENKDFMLYILKSTTFLLFVLKVIVLTTLIYFFLFF